MKRLDVLLNKDLKELTESEKESIIAQIDKANYLDQRHLNRIAAVGYNLALQNSDNFDKETIAKLYNISLKSLDIRESDDFCTSQFSTNPSHLFFMVGYFAKILVERTKDEETAEKGFRILRNYANLTAKINPHKSAFSVSLGADIGKALFESTCSDIWGARWYSGKRDSAEKTEKIDPLYSAHAFGFAGQAAKEVSRKKRKPHFKTEAIESYRKALEMFHEQKPNPKIKGLMKSLERELKFVCSL